MLYLYGSDLMGIFDGIRNRERYKFNALVKSELDAERKSLLEVRDEMDKHLPGISAGFPSSQTRYDALGKVQSGKVEYAKLVMRYSERFE